MKSYNRLSAAVFLLITVLFLTANLNIHYMEPRTHGRMYLVETARLVKQIRNNGWERLDLSGCEYIRQVKRCEDAQNMAADRLQQFLEETDSDCCIRLIQGDLYRFDYTMDTSYWRGCVTRQMNLALAGAGLVLAGVLIYIRRNLIRPFEAMKDIPYELSKGRLTVPLPECKNRYFGRFLWGMDLLREHIEQMKQQELSLQCAQKTLILSVSHDIKTPLSAIKLYTRVISRHLYADVRQLDGIAGNIEAKADEIGGFVTQMIKACGEDFLNIEIGKDGFYLSELVKKTASYYEDKLKLLHTQFFIGDYPDCLVKGDFDRGVEVLQNLMENAVKYGDGRSIALVFGEEEDCVLVTVKNSGNTLPESEFLHIFDSFWRGSNARGSTGSGLGLYICRGLMQRMDGEIFAQVQDGEMCVTAVFRK